MKKATIGILVLAAAALALLAALQLGGTKGPEEPRGQETREARRLTSRGKRDAKRPAEAVREAMGGVANDAARRKRRPPAELFAHLSGKDRRVAEAIQAALDNDDFDATLAATVKALASTNAEVRLHAVDALGWFGLDALPELTEAMADPDEDVAESAENAWELALSEMPQADRRFAVAAAALGTLSNEDHLTTIVGQLTGAALEMIDGEDDEEKANDNRVAVVQALVDVMDLDRAVNTREAREAYEDITGNEWVSIDEAERYLSDPDNYEPPEDRDDDYDDGYDDDDYDDDEGGSGVRSSGTGRKAKTKGSSKSRSSYGGDEGYEVEAPQDDADGDEAVDADEGDADGAEEDEMGEDPEDEDLDGDPEEADEEEAPPDGEEGAPPTA